MFLEILLIKMARIENLAIFRTKIANFPLRITRLPLEAGTLPIYGLSLKKTFGPQTRRAQTKWEA